MEIVTNHLLELLFCDTLWNDFGLFISQNFGVLYLTN